MSCGASAKKYEAKDDATKDASTSEAKGESASGFFDLLPLCCAVRKKKTVDGGVETAPAASGGAWSVENKDTPGGGAGTAENKDTVVGGAETSEAKAGAALSSEKASDLRRHALRVGAIEEEVDRVLEQPHLRQALIALIKSKTVHPPSAPVLAQTGKVQNKEHTLSDVVLWSVGHRYTGIKMPNGDSVNIVNAVADEYKVVWRGQEGWVKKHHIHAQVDRVHADAAQAMANQRAADAAANVDGRLNWEALMTDPPLHLKRILELSQLHDVMTVQQLEKFMMLNDLPAKSILFSDMLEYVAQAQALPPTRAAPEPAPEQQHNIDVLANDLVQKARKVMEECWQAAPVMGAPKYTEPESIWEILNRQTEPVKLLRGTWVTEYANSEGQQKGFPRRQDLEKMLAKKAFLPSADVECKKLDSGVVLNVASISYCWRAAKHPDEDGQQLRAVARKLDWLLRSKQFSDCFNDAGIFWDFCSLHQKDDHGRRRREEQQAFNEALRDMGIWYLHSLIMTYIVNMTIPHEASVDYESRGWTFFERSCAELIKPTIAGGGRDNARWLMTTEFQVYRRRLPVPPEEFARQLAHKRFTNSGDKETVVKLYTKSFMEALRGICEINLNEITLQSKSKSLASVLQHCCSLKVLWLNGMNMGAAEAQHIAGVLTGMRSLENLHLQENKLDDAGACAIAGVLPSMQSLQELRLGSNKIGGTGACAILAALPSMQSFKFLYLLKNEMGDAGAGAITCVLPSMRSFHVLELYLFGNEMGDVVACAIAGALPSMQSLQALDLSRNKIGDAGACAIAGALPSMQSLQLLRLDHNKIIGDAGACAIAGALRSMQSLQELRLDYSNIGVAGACAIAGALPSMQSLQVLGLQQNKIGDVGACALRSHCQARIRMYI